MAQSEPFINTQLKHGLIDTIVDPANIYDTTDIVVGVITVLYKNGDT